MKSRYQAEVKSSREALDSDCIQLLLRSSNRDSQNLGPSGQADRTLADA